MAEEVKILKCPICSKEYKGTLQVIYEDGKATCKHDVDIKKQNLEDLRRANAAATMEAMKLAAQMKGSTPEEKMVIVESFQEGSEGKTERVPESVVKSLEEKAKRALEGL